MITQHPDILPEKLYGTLIYGSCSRQASHFDLVQPMAEVKAGCVHKCGKVLCELLKRARLCVSVYTITVND